MGENTIPRPGRPYYHEASKALAEAHQACFGHPARDVLGISSGPFSGVNRVLEIVDELEQENITLRAKLSASPSPPGETDTIKDKFPTCSELNVRDKCLSPDRCRTEHICVANELAKRFDENRPRLCSRCHGAGRVGSFACSRCGATGQEPPGETDTGWRPSEEDIARVIFGSASAREWAAVHAADKHAYLAAARAVLKLFRASDTGWQDRAVGTLTRCAQLLDTMKQEWSPEGHWSEWDQSVRSEITRLLFEHHGIDAPLPPAPQLKTGG